MVGETMQQEIETTPESAEATFYHAFEQCDANAMRKVWADDGVVCVHPGANPITNLEAIIRSWEHIFAGATPPRIETRLVQSFVQDGLTVRIVEEHIGPASAATATARVLATNVYRHVETGWRMVSHHGSPLPAAALARETRH
jgi:ketosteroid isomerase-like protein